MCKSLDQKNDSQLIKQKQIYFFRKNLEEIKIIFTLLEEKISENSRINEQLIKITNEDLKNASQ